MSRDISKVRTGIEKIYWEEHFIKEQDVEGGGGVVGIEELRSDRIQALAVILENFKQRNDTSTSYKKYMDVEIRLKGSKGRTRGLDVIIQQ